MAQQTAMKYALSLVEQMYNNAKTPEVESAMNDVINIITQEGIPMEKEQIRNAYNDGHTWAMEDKPGMTSGTIYYNETYGTEQSTK